MDHEQSKKHSFESYLQALALPNGLQHSDQSRSPLWGGELEFLAMSNQHQIEIIVFQYDQPSDSLTQLMRFNDGQDLSSLSILYAGGVHYDYINRSSST